MFGTLDGAWLVSSQPPPQGCGSKPRAVHMGCGRQSGNGTGFPTVLLFLPVSIIPPILYTQSFIHHQNYVTLTTDSVI
jgi:hypothetical protein